MHCATLTSRVIVPDTRQDKYFDIRDDGLPDRGAVTTVDGNTSLYSTKLYRLRAVAFLNPRWAGNALPPARWSTSSPKLLGRTLPA